MPMITGYSGCVSVTAGGSLPLHLSTDVSAVVTLHLYSLDDPAASVLDLRDVSVANQIVPDQRAWEGFRWRETVRLPIPSSLPSGLYEVRALPRGERAEQEICRVVVKAPTPGSTSRIGLMVNFLTPEAYNGTGGKSLYDFTSIGGPSAWVSFDRPQLLSVAATESNGFYEQMFLPWLRRERIQVECFADLDIDESASLALAYDLIVMVGHHEYWTREMRDHLDC